LHRESAQEQSRSRQKNNYSAESVKEGGEYPESETVKPTECGTCRELIADVKADDR
jgi:hypothetical protein